MHPSLPLCQPSTSSSRSMNTHCFTHKLREGKNEIFISFKTRVSPVSSSHSDTLSFCSNKVLQKQAIFHPCVETIIMAMATSILPSSTKTALSHVRLKKNRVLNLADCIEVITERNAGKAIRHLAIEFGCGKKQILDILAKSATYFDKWRKKQEGSLKHSNSNKKKTIRSVNKKTHQHKMVHININYCNVHLL